MIKPFDEHDPKRQELLDDYLTAQKKTWQLERIVWDYDQEHLKAQLPTITTKAQEIFGGVIEVIEFKSRHYIGKADANAHPLVIRTRVHGDFRLEAQALLEAFPEWYVYPYDLYRVEIKVVPPGWCHDMPGWYGRPRYHEFGSVV